MNNRLDLLPNEIYQNILKYVFIPKVYLQRWNNITKQWNKNIFINRCFICKQSVKNIGLSYNCTCYMPDLDRLLFGSLYIESNCKDGCKNQLICWNCGH